MKQLDILFNNKEDIETVFIEPTKEMPIEVYRELHRLSYFMEHMERISENIVRWDDKLESIYDESLADVEYLALQNDWFVHTMEVPKIYIL